MIEALSFLASKSVSIPTFFEPPSPFTPSAINVKESLDGVFDQTWGEISREAASFKKVWNTACTAAPEVGNQAIINPPINPPAVASAVNAVRDAVVHAHEQASAHLPTALSSVRATLTTWKKEIGDQIPLPVRLAWRVTPTSVKVVGACFLIWLYRSSKSEQHVTINIAPPTKV